MARRFSRRSSGRSSYSSRRSSRSSYSPRRTRGGSRPSTGRRGSARTQRGAVHTVRLVLEQPGFNQNTASVMPGMRPGTMVATPQAPKRAPF